MTPGLWGIRILKTHQNCIKFDPHLKTGGNYVTNPNTALLFSGNPWKSPYICIVCFCLISPKMGLLKVAPVTNESHFLCQKIQPCSSKTAQLTFDWLTAIRIRPTSEQNMRRSTLGPWQALSGYMRWDGWPGEDANIGAVDAERNLDGSEILRENHLGCINKSYR